MASVGKVEQETVFDQGLIYIDTEHISQYQEEEKKVLILKNSFFFTWALSTLYKNYSPR